MAKKKLPKMPKMPKGTAAQAKQLASLKGKRAHAESEAAYWTSVKRAYAERCRALAKRLVK